MSEIDIAVKAVQLYAAMHPRPVHVTLAQAAEMLEISEPTARKLERSGALKRNRCGKFPISQVDKLLQA